MNKFAIGEIAIYVSSHVHTSPGMLARSGQEVEITKPPGIHHPFTDTPVYGLKFSDGVTGYAMESCLRKKRPPKDEGAREWFEKNIDVTKQPVHA